MRFFISSLILLLSLSMTQAQSLERVVIGAAGGEAQSGNTHLEYTAGEAVTSTLVAGTFVLNQGFNQTNQSANTSIQAPKLLEVSYRLYPNPTRDQIQLELQAGERMDLKAEVWDLTGRQMPVPIQSWRQVQEVNTTFDLSSLATGMYLLRIFDGQGKAAKTLRIEKI